jgi:hypothetical protein
VGHVRGGTCEGKTDVGSANPACRKLLTSNCQDFVLGPMSGVHHGVDTRARDNLSGLEGTIVESRFSRHLCGLLPTVMRSTVFAPQGGSGRLKAGSWAHLLRLPLPVPTDGLGGSRVVTDDAKTCDLRSAQPGTGPPCKASSNGSCPAWTQHDGRLPASNSGKVVVRRNQHEKRKLPKNADAIAESLCAIVMWTLQPSRPPTPS